MIQLSRNNSAVLAEHGQLVGGAQSWQQEVGPGGTTDQTGHQPGHLMSETLLKASGRLPHQRQDLVSENLGQATFAAWLCFDLIS